jgi:hypothetical protein
LSESVIKCENFLVFVGASGLKTRVEGFEWIGEQWMDPMV